jgi:hypothetical protein
MGNGGKITLVANDLVDGKGMGKLILQSDNLAKVDPHEMPEELKGETSVQINPVSLTKEIAPTNASVEVGSIFSTAEDQPAQTNDPAQMHQGVNRTAVDRLAATVAPEQGAEGQAIVTKDEVPTPQEFRQLEDPECKTFVSSLQELMVEVEAAKTKSSGIDLDSIANPRERALAKEQKEQMEAIDKSAFVVNDQAGVLSINDLDITLALNMPYDLSKISAKRIAGSSELKGLIRSGLIKFITPDEIPQYTNRAVYEAPSLSVFDNKDQAEANMATMQDNSAVGTVSQAPTQLHSQNGPMISEDAMEVNADNFDQPTEEELMIQNLTSGMGANPQATTSKGVRTTVHGS